MQRKRGQNPGGAEGWGGRVGRLLRVSRASRGNSEFIVTPPHLLLLPRIAEEGGLLVTVGPFWWAPELALGLLLQP